MSRSMKLQIKRRSLGALSILLPGTAGRIATDWFSQSRHMANPPRQAYAPFGARVIKTWRPQDESDAIGIANSPTSNNHHRDSSVYELHGQQPRPPVHPSPGHKQAAHVDEYYLWGDSGDIVLLVHGWGSDCSSMFGFIKPLLAAGYRVATFDAPAHGGSPGRLATMRQYVDSIRAAMLELGQVKAIIAHSLGGIAAVAAARGLTGSGPESHPKVAHNCAPLQRLALIAAPRSLMQVLDIWAQTCLPPGPRLKNRILNELLLRNQVPVSHWDIALHGENWHIPTLVMHDSEDEIVSCSHAQQIKNVFTNSQLINTHGLGHRRILTDRQVISDCVEFLRHNNSANQHPYGLRLASVTPIS